MKNQFYSHLLAVLLATQLLPAIVSGSTLEAKLSANADGSVNVVFRGVPGQAYRVEISSDGDTWKTATDNVVAGKDWTTWTDTGASTLTQQYYRVVPQDKPATTITISTNVLSSIVDSGLHFLADSNTIQSATAVASDSWARVKEAGDAGLIVGALGAGNISNAMAVLKEYGIDDATAKNMADRLNKAPTVAGLKEKFIRGVVAVNMSDPDSQVRGNFKTASAQGRGRAYWVIKSLGPDWTTRYDQELAQMATPPIAVLDMKLEEIDLIRFFKWYDRYADKIHSVLLNSENLSNWDLKNRYDDANLLLSGMWRLIKARNPDAFVWVRVVWQDDDSDVRWLQSLKFKPDGLVIWNLHSFMSPFDRARQKYTSILGESTPLMVAEFYGFWPIMEKISDKKLKDIGQIIDSNLDRFETRIQEAGYSGLMVSWRTVQAVSQARQ